MAAMSLSPRAMTAVSNRIRRVPFASKMHIFQAEVGGDQGFITARQRQHRAVIANSHHATSALARYDSAYPLNQQLFCQGHIVLRAQL